MNDKITYYVDESGDLNLFKRKGKPNIEEGQPKHIMLGLLKIKDEEFDNTFLKFKNDIASDSIFQSIESFQRKTRHSFHAKDDHLAIKREMFKFIAQMDLSIQVVIRNKTALIEEATSLFKFDGRKLSDKQIYNSLVTRLFKGKLHKASHYDIIFSQRGNSTENSSLRQSLKKAGDNFYETFGIVSNSHYKISSCKPSTQPGLQIVDYCLWALQRLYNYCDPVYFNLIKDKFKLVHDVDHKDNNPYGEFYDKKGIEYLLERFKGKLDSDR